MGIVGLMAVYPKLSVIMLSFLVTLVMTLVTKKFTNQNRMKELKEIQKKCKIDLKDAKNEPEKIKKINVQMMECSMELMKHSFKPMFYTFIPLILFFWWIKGVYVETTLASTWIWWYIGASIVSSMILRKVLKVA